MMYAGICQNDIYKRAELKSIKKGPTSAHSDDILNKFLILPSETMKAKCEEYRAAYNALNVKGETRVEINNCFEFNEDHETFQASGGLTIHLSEDLDVSQINNIAILSGGDLSSLKIREILTEEFVVKCKEEVVMKHQTKLTCKDQRYLLTFIYDQTLF